MNENGRVRVEAPLDPEKDYIVGRNGTFPLTALQIWGGKPTVYVDGIGRRGKIVRGGFALRSHQALDRACRQWLEQREVLSQLLLDDRETASVLAGLRLLQGAAHVVTSDGPRPPGFPETLEIATNGGEFEPLDAEETGELCERINSATARVEVAILYVPDDPVQAILVNGRNGWDLTFAGEIDGDAAALLGNLGHDLGITFDVDEVEVDPVASVGPGWDWLSVAEAWVEQREQAR
jgi:hypothetical protein